MSQHDRDSEEHHVRGEVRRFKQHLLTYLSVIALLFVINFVTGGFWHGHFWFFWVALFWVALFWGIAIVFQATRLFGDDIGREWEERMVKRIMARRQARAGNPPPTSSSGPKPPEPPTP